MLNVIFLTFIFSITTVLSILFLGSRAIIGTTMNFPNIVRILFSWQFLVGAFFAFFSRLLFMMINSALYKIPYLASSSTTVTTFITSISLIFVAIANYFFLHEKISAVQGVGAFIIIVGILLISK
jgi:drug/metabolite transporter (DMT)-like permease